MVPPKTCTVGLGLPRFAFFPPGLPTLRSFGYHQADFLCVLLICLWAEAGQNMGTAGCRGRGESCTEGQTPAGKRERGKGL